MACKDKAKDKHNSVMRREGRTWGHRPPSAPAPPPMDWLQDPKTRAAGRGSWRRGSWDLTQQHRLGTRASRTPAPNRNSQQASEWPQGAVFVSSKVAFLGAGASTVWGGQCPLRGLWVIDGPCGGWGMKVFGDFPEITGVTVRGGTILQAAVIQVDETWLSSAVWEA